MTIMLAGMLAWSWRAHFSIRTFHLNGEKKTSDVKPKKKSARRSRGTRPQKEGKEWNSIVRAATDRGSHQVVYIAHVVYVRVRGGLIARPFIYNLLLATGRPKQRSGFTRPVIIYILLLNKQITPAGSARGRYTVLPARVFF
jgi:hypothetical protein